MNIDFYGQIFYKGRFYTWEFTFQHNSVSVSDTSFKVLRTFKIDVRLLNDKSALIEKIKEELDKDTAKTTVDYEAFSDTANDIFES